MKTTDESFDFWLHITGSNLEKNGLKVEKKKSIVSIQQAGKATQNKRKLVPARQNIWPYSMLWN